MLSHGVHIFYSSFFFSKSKHTHKNVVLHVSSNKIKQTEEKKIVAIVKITRGIQ